ncbi:hypothetical protein DICPUDRAFT_148999 [Dictyostelium purpureum]|uniref:DNA-(apurinic or apyrimidinic site) lyase n=1 Tax=Dictyostelium purpureum TaxID=5786 RepID=F0ZCJ6_DICPU|nr:uncharacterized protein DICPUDRAFT_148999 [Dictyostelium purpureum]EGC38310.1 hypothetical protein DICPUDRAFT_148999 [Dictyostelium purpureum]|eukprot:XP_003285171.1 hypothetical protein DICPUDRAFT_148999 [Dictyostelium purpureum]
MDNKNSSNQEWECYQLNNNVLDLKKTLFSGQSFIWSEVKEKDIIEFKNESTSENLVYIGVINKYIVLLRYKEFSNNNIIEFKFKNSNNLVNKEIVNQSEQDRLEILKDYFNLKYDINELFSQWRADSVKDLKQLHSLNSQFREASESFKGLRLIKQNPLDCLFSFICSQNNNIGRISKMVKSLITTYGTKISDFNGQSYYQFPTLEQLSVAKEKDLNDMGFGYRSRYIVESCKQVIANGGEEWLNGLVSKPHTESHKELISLMGKHLPNLKGTLSPKMYKHLNEFWEKIFGPQAGWAHTILFANEISAFKNENKESNKKKTKKEKEEIKEEEEEEVKAENKKVVNKRQKITK